MRTLRGNMANYRRCYVPGGSFFVTVVTERRAAILGNETSRVRMGYLKLLPLDRQGLLR